MPLDPRTQAMLDAINALGLPPIEEAPVEVGRQMMASLAALRPPGPPMASVEDRVVAGPGGDIPVRVYRPSEASGLPVLLFLHGGGWVFGDLETHDATCRSLAAGAGCLVVAVHYRRAPEAPFPAAVEDGEAVLRWLASNAPAIGGDPHRLAVGGDSAGGNLAAVLARRARDQGGPVLRFQLLIYPVTECMGDRPSMRENADGYLLTRAGMEWFWKQYLPEGTDRQHADHSPIHVASLAGLPPALVLTAEYDPLRDEGEAYAERLRADGVPTQLVRYDGVVHGFYAMGADLPQAEAALALSVEVLRQALA